MTVSLYIQCVAMYILGQALHLFVIKIPAVRKRDRAANIEFSFSDYWKQEWNIIIGNQVLGAVFIIGLDQLVDWKPLILDVVKWFFAAVGAIGSVTIMSKFSTYEKKVLNIIDEKTNLSDRITGNAPSKVSEQGQ
jgi:hypothetical protein